MSKDDDFCSHCGSAVWGENDISTNAAINCDSDGHTHDKVTYNRTERGEGVHIPEGYKPYNPTNQNDQNSSGDSAKNAKSAATIIKIILIIIAANAIVSFFAEFFN